MDNVMDHVCAVESLRKTYGSGVVTDRDLSLRVSAGEVLGPASPNEWFDPYLGTRCGA